MTKITGRPPKAVKQEKNIGFFVTLVQYAIIQHKATQAGVNISDYMRQMAIYGKVTPRWQPEERDQFKKLVAIANDIHEMVKVAKQEGLLHAMTHFEEYRSVMDEVIKYFRHDK